MPDRLLFRSDSSRLVRIILVIAALSMSGCATNLGVAPPSTPNILLIIADDLSPSYVSAYGMPGAPSTPIIDELAAEGLTFLQAWANPACSPTRAGFYTGQHAWRHGVGHPSPGIMTGLATAESLPNVLQARDYRSALFGKWHLDAVWQATGTSPSDETATFPNLYDFGWHTYMGSPDGVIRQLAGPSDYRNWYRIDLSADSSNEEIEAGDFATHGNVSDYVTTTTRTEATAWIAGNSTQPWFVAMAFNAPHSPFHDPADSGNGASCPVGMTDLDCYTAMVQDLDTNIGLMIIELSLMTYNDGSSVYDHTVVIFIGDNGSPAGMEATPFNPVICSSGLEPCAKSTVFEGGLRVPFIISGPMGVDAAVRGTQTDIPVHTTDIYETVLDYPCRRRRGACT
jgi:arylsulfatase A-like enzyme